MYKTVPFSQYCFSCFHKVLVSDCHIRLYRHHMIYLLSNGHHAATQILLSIIFSSCGNSNPIVNYIFIIQQLKSWSWHQICDTSFFFIIYEFYIKAGSMCLKICYCNHYLMWLVLLLLCGHK